MSLRVVLADDHVVLRQGVRALLERHGFEVVAEASDGRTAVELTRQHEPNVAVLDIMMPLLNGIDAACQIVEACPGTQVVMLTALEQERLVRSEEHTSELQSRLHLVCRLLLEKKKLTGGLSLVSTPSMFEDD